MKTYILSAIVALIWAWSAVAAESTRSCHADVACKVDGRFYHVKEPDDWDGVPDLRAFFDSDLRWLRHYGFASLDVPTLHGGLSR